MRPLLCLTDDDVRTFGDGELLIRDGLFPRDSVLACSEQMTRLDAERRFGPAGMGGAPRRDAAYRGDRTSWDDEGTALPGLRAFFDAVRRELNEVAWLGLAAFTIQLAIFDAGARYGPHRDTLAGDRTRRATAILYLNPSWAPEDGGCLRVHAPSGCRDVEPLGGRLVLFRSDALLHEVLPSYRARYAATAWFRGRASDPGRITGRD